MNSAKHNLPCSFEEKYIFLSYDYFLDRGKALEFLKSVPQNLIEIP